MATAQYLVTTEKSETSTSHHRYYNVSECNNKARAQIPRYSRINSVTVKYEVTRGGVNLSSSNADARIMFADSYSTAESGRIILGEWINEITTSYKEFSASMTSYCFSQNYNAGEISSSAINNYTKLYFSAVGILVRKYSTKNLCIHWDYTPPTFTISTNTNGGGSISGGGTFNVAVTDQTKTITATPSAGYKFVKWVDSNGNTYNTASVNVIISQNSISAFSTTVTYTAYFEAIKHTVTVTAGAGGSVTGGGTYNYGGTATLTAVANTGYKFKQWSDGNTSATRTVTVTSDLSYTATFEKLSYIITVSGTNGTVAGGGTYEYGSTVEITAIPNAGYKFKQWSDGATSITRTITVTGNATYTAIFELDKINKILVDTSQSSTVLIDTTTSSAVYVDTTKVYG